MNYVALICARGGSKGLPDKNIRMLAGRPLIAWSIVAAKNVNRISRVIVSTDSEKIAEVAKSYGAEVPFIRPDELASDESPEWLVWRHALEYLNSASNECVDGLIVIPTTAPLRKAIDLDNCLNEYEGGNVDIVITVSEAHRNPYFNMVTANKNGCSSLVIHSNKGISRRQDAPDVYDMTTVAYVVKPNYVNQSNGIFDGGVVRQVLVPIERSLDIDTLIDFKIAECLSNDRKDMQI